MHFNNVQIRYSILHIYYIKTSIFEIILEMKIIEIIIKIMYLMKL